MASGVVTRPSVEELVADPATLNVERLELQLRTHAAHIATATARFLALVAEYDRRKAYEQWECITCARWLELHCQVSAKTAHEYVRVARKLAELPAIAEAFAHGEISYSKVRALTRVAGPASDMEMLNLARQMSAAQLATVTGAMERVIREETDARLRATEDNRGVDRWVDDNKGVVVWTLSMSRDEDMTLRFAIEAARERYLDEARKANKAADGGPSVARGIWAEDVRQRRLGRLEAILAAVEAGLANHSGEIPERYLTVLNIDTQAVGSDGTGAVLLGEGVRLHPAVAQRLSCDTAIQLRVVDGDGGVRMGRRMRTFTNKQRQLIAQHFATCGFPGCSVRAGRCQFHHVVRSTKVAGAYGATGPAPSTPKPPTAAGSPELPSFPKRRGPPTPAASSNSTSSSASTPTPGNNTNGPPGTNSATSPTSSSANPDSASSTTPEQNRT